MRGQNTDSEYGKRGRSESQATPNSAKKEAKKRH